MVSKFRMTKVKIYPQPHDVTCQFGLNADTAGQNCTIIPAIVYDENVDNVPALRKTHPLNAAFVETAEPNCSPDSKIFNISCSMRVTMTDLLLNTDKPAAIRFAFMSIHGAFEDFDAKEEVGAITVGAVCEITKETTDRQTYPIYDATDLVVKYTGSSDIGTTKMDHALTATSKAENVAFDIGLYYDAINYMTISDKLKKVQDGLRWITLTQQNPTRLIKFNIKSNVKALNPYTFLGHMVIVPLASTRYQIPVTADTSNATSLWVEYRCRYLEWNDNFNFDRVDPA